MSDNFYQHQNATAPNVVPLHSAWGDPVGGREGHSTGGNIQLARGYSTAPYKEPASRHVKEAVLRYDEKGRQLCSHNGDCKAFAMKEFPFCPGHARSLGLKKWSPKPITKQQQVYDRRRKAKQKKARLERERKARLKAAAEEKVEEPAHDDAG